MKKIISLICCLLAAVTAIGTFSACKSKNDGKYVLTIGYESGGYGTAWIENAVTKFCEKEGIDRKQVYIEAEKGYTSGVMDKLATGIRIRDVLIGCGNTARSWAAFGYLEPVDDVLSTTLSTGKTLKESLLNQDLLTGITHKNSVYAIPSIGGGAYGIYYNKTMFEQKGWEVPATYSELLTLCGKIYRDEVENAADGEEIYPFVVSADIIDYWDFVVQNWIAQSMGVEKYYEYSEMAKDTGKAMFKADSVYSRAKIKALEAYDRLAVQNNHYVKSDSSDYMAAQMLFCQGKAAMMPNADWFEQEVSASLPADMEIAIMPTPILDGAVTDENGNAHYNYMGDLNGGYMIPAKAAHKDMAKKFLAFLAEPEIIKDTFLLGGNYGAFEADFSTVVSKMTACQKSVYETIKNAKSFGFRTPSNLALSNLAPFWLGSLGKPYSYIAYGKGSAKDYVNTIEAYVNAEWDNMWELV